VRRPTGYVALGLLAVALAVMLALALTRPPAPGPGALNQVACTGRAGDSAALRTAIAKMTDGSTLVISGTCYLTQPLVLTAGRTYEGTTGNGTSDGTLLVQHFPLGNRYHYLVANQAYAYDRARSGTGSALTIQDLGLSCRSRTDSGLVLLAWQAIVDHVDVTGCGNGIVDTSQDRSGTPLRPGQTSVNSRFDDNFISGSAHYGFYVEDPGNAVTDGFFQDNLVAGSGQAAIRLENSAGWNISGNHLYTDAGDAIDASRLWGTTISGNYIEDFGAGRTAGTWYGILGGNQCGSGSTIDNNLIFNLSRPGSTATFDYLAVTQNSAHCTGYLTVTGNVINAKTPGSRGTGLYFHGNGAGGGLIVGAAGNVVAGVTRQVSQAGASVSGQ
jgi:hypothetical protein